MVGMCDAGAIIAREDFFLELTLFSNRVQTDFVPGDQISCGMCKAPFLYIYIEVIILMIEAVEIYGACIGFLNIQNVSDCKKWGEEESAKQQVMV